MKPFPKEQIRNADSTNIAAYLISQGIHLEKNKDKYLWKEENVWIDGSQWYSFYEQEGGHAIGFLEKYFSMTFPEAVNELLGNNTFNATPYIEKNGRKNDGKKEHSSSSFALPRPSDTCRQVFGYLIKRRGIAPEIVSHFVKAETIYEDAPGHNCVFIGKDEKGIARHCHRRGTSGTFKNNVSGSDAQYSFHHIGTDDTVYVFEAPIDMLAFISMHRDNWQKHSYVALCSVADKALFHQLEAHPNLRKIFLCLDNDTAGREASKRIADALSRAGYSEIKILTPVHKDWDEDLVITKHANINEYYGAIVT